MENMDKELTVPKWVLIVPPKIPQIPQKISAQNVCPSPIFLKKSSLWVTLVCDSKDLTKLNILSHYNHPQMLCLVLRPRQTSPKMDV